MLLSPQCMLLQRQIAVQALLVKLFLNCWLFSEALGFAGGLQSAHGPRMLAPECSFVAAGGLQNVTSMFTFLVDQYLQPTGVPVAKLLETPPLGQHVQHSTCVCCRTPSCLPCRAALRSCSACSSTLLAAVLVSLA